MKNFSTTFCLLIIIASVTSCKTSKRISMNHQEKVSIQPTENKGATITQEELNGTWIIKTAKGKTVIGDSPVEITFDLTNGRIYGNDGCNVINGTAFFENENGLRFESLISTMKACRPEVTDRTVLNALNETRSYKRADTKELSIKFCDEKGKSVMTLEKRMVDLLNGSWKVTTIDGKKITEENPTMVIDIPEAKLSGFAGCNRMFGGISLDGTAFGIAFTQVATTRMACPDMKTEQLFLSALGKVTGFYMIDKFHAALYQQPQTPIIIIEKVQ